MRKGFNIIFLTLAVFILADRLPNVSSADTIEEIQEKIDEANESRAELEKEIAKYQGQLNVVSGQATNLQNTIKSLDISTNKITTEVKLTSTNINKTSLNIEDTGLQIKDKERQISTGQKAIIETLRQINNNEDRSLLEAVLADDDLSQFWIDMENTIQVQSKIGALVVTVKSVKADLEIAKAELEKKRKELEGYTKELAAKKTVLVSTKKEKSTLLATTKNTEAAYQKILQDKLALKAALDQEIYSFESQLKLKIDPTSFPAAGKGILAWPVDNVVITQKFGITSFSKTAYSSGSHNGVDFGVAIGTKLKSAGNGVVDGVGDTDTVCPGASFGKWVFIRYDNGLASTYGHLSLISVKPGQIVKTGDVIGYSGKTGYATGPHLHFSVYAGQGVKVSTLKSAVCKGTYTMPIADPKAYLDPLIYL